MRSKAVKEFFNLRHRIKDTSLQDAVKILFLIFITYAVIDVFWKITTHSQYDMQRLAKDIQEYFPDSRLTFQNIKVVDNDLKVSHGHRGGTTIYQDTTYLYIRHGCLQEEPNFLVVLFLLPLVIIFSVFTIDKPDIKLKDIPKIDPFVKGVLLIALFIILFLVTVLPDNKYYFNKHKNPKAFTFEVEANRKDININDYRK
ncbi:hypothetical protein [uncultured Algibacter sp.]|uniref:hypothetical protein n=1 Tax=uncultured Algibacter sp. TaxID=298659 RepID=UPI00321742EE